jgi:hypothetical protein
MSGERLGASIAAIAGLVFILINSGSLPGETALLVRLLGIVAFALVWFAVIRRTSPGQHPMIPDPRARRIYWSSVTFEALLIPLGASTLGRNHRPELVVPWVALVVGVHFLPFAKAFAVNGFRPLAWCLIGLAMIGGIFALTLGATVGTVVAGVLSGVALLTFSAYLGRVVTPNPG